MNDEPTPKIYATPSLPAFALYIVVAIALFFAGFNWHTYIDVAELKRSYPDVKELKETLGDLQTQVRDLKADNQRLRAAVGSRAKNGDAAAFLPAAASEEKVLAAAPAAEEVSPAAGPTPAVKRLLANRARPELSAPPLAIPEPAPKPAAAPEAPEAPAAMAAPKTAPDAPAPKAAVADEKTPPAAAPIEILTAKVLASNPDQMRVILSVGEAGGVEAGKRFNIYRDGNWVGDVRVTHAYADHCLCEIVTTPRGVRIGDVAKSVNGAADDAADGKGARP